MEELAYKPQIGEIEANRVGLGASLAGLWADCSIDLIGAHHGKPVNGARPVPGPQGGRAVQCDGSNDYVPLGSAGYVLTEGCLFARVYFPSTAGGSRCCIAQSGGSTGFFVGLGWQSTTAWVGGNDGGVSVAGSFTAVVRQWTTLAITWGPFGVRCFQDGKLKASNASTTAHMNNGGGFPLTIGCFYYPGGAILQQAVICDFLALFEQQPTDCEVAKLSANPLQLVRQRRAVVSVSAAPPVAATSSNLLILGVG